MSRASGWGLRPLHAILNGGRGGTEPFGRRAAYSSVEGAMKLPLFVLLLLVCWPAALALLVLYPVIWLVLLPFRLVGLTVRGVFDLVRAGFELPLKLVRAL